MGAKVKPIFDEGLENHIYLGLINPQGPFPSKIYAHAICLSDEPVLYVPRIFAHAMVIMEDDDSVVGHCTCSICNKSINMFDKYCVHCGAKIKSQIFLGENND